MPSKMGIGNLGFPDIVIKDKIRFTLEGDFPAGKFAPQLVNAARPKLNIEENFLRSNTFVPGKQEWMPVTTTFLEECNSKELAELFSLLSTLYDLTKVSPEYETSFPDDQKGTLKLKLYDGFGNILECWELYEAYPVSISFGYLGDIDSLIDLTWKYNKVIYHPTKTQKLNNLDGRQGTSCVD